MAKELKVISPFFVVKEGDTFELNDKGMYVHEYFFEEDDLTVEDNGHSSFSSVYTISPDVAKAYIEQGYLEEVREDKTFVNVFNEIKNLRQQYAYELSRIDEDMENKPACLRIEKETVLSNLIKVLDHLYACKK